MVPWLKSFWNRVVGRIVRPRQKRKLKRMLGADGRPMTLNGLPVYEAGPAVRFSGPVAYGPLDRYRRPLGSAPDRSLPTDFRSAKRHLAGARPDDPREHRDEDVPYPAESDFPSWRADYGRKPPEKPPE